MSAASVPEPGVNPPNISAIDIVRVIVLLVALFTLGFWGFAGWAFPWNLVFGIGLPIIALLIWATFLSPRPMLQLHPFVRAAIELLVYATVTLAWWSMDQAWVGIGFAVVAVTTGLLNGRKALR